jgi:hypothetical protein
MGRGNAKLIRADEAQNTMLLERLGVQRLHSTHSRPPRQKSTDLQRKWIIESIAFCR